MNNFQYQTTSVIPSRFEVGAQVKIYIEAGNHHDLSICNEIIKKLIDGSDSYQKHQELQLQNVNSDDMLVVPLFLLLCLPPSVDGSREFVRNFKTPEGDDLRIVLSGHDPLSGSLLERKLIFHTLSRCIANKQREVRYKTFISLLRDLSLIHI